MVRPIVRPTKTWPHPCVAIGASGGEGLRDIIELLSALPRPFSGVVLVTLHRPTDRISQLREVLARSSHMTVRIAKQDEKLEPSTVYIGNPDQHLELITLRHAGLVQDRRSEHRNRTIDILFKSLAANAGPAQLGSFYQARLMMAHAALKLSTTLAVPRWCSRLIAAVYPACRKMRLTIMDRSTLSVLQP